MKRHDTPYNMGSIDNFPFLHEHSLRSMSALFLVHTLFSLSHTQNAIRGEAF